MRRVVGWVAVLVWLLLPVGLFALACQQSGAHELYPASTVWAPVVQAKGTVQDDVSISLLWDSGTPMVAPAWQGVVQAVKVKDGDTVVDHQVIARVEGIDRLSYRAEFPFTTPLGSGARSEQVAALNDLLARWQLSHAGDDRYSSATVRGVRDLARSLGMPKADGRSFDPAWLVFLPADSLVASEVSLTVGAPAPAAGEEIVVPAMSLTQAWLSPRQDAAAQAKSPDPAGAGAVVASPGQQLTVAGTDIPMEADGIHIADEGLVSLASLVQGEAPGINAVLISPAPAGMLQVPGNALYADTSGKLCALARTPSGKPTPVAVEVTSSRDGVSIISGALTTDQSLLVAPPPQDRVPCR